MNPNLGQLNREHFFSAHEDTMFCQFLFPELKAEEIRPDTFTYPPCWGILDPGMTMEKHHHAFVELYVFTQGEGEMLLGEDRFPVKAGMSVNIPSEMMHEVSCSTDATAPIIWISIGLS